MSDPRYVIDDRTAVILSGPIGDATITPLPDAEHIHVTRHPDGTITAEVMRPTVAGAWSHSSLLWVDCPTGGDQ